MGDRGTPVTPAKAGVCGRFGSQEIPAFAGMTLRSDRATVCRVDAGGVMRAGGTTVTPAKAGVSGRYGGQENRAFAGMTVRDEHAAVRG